jgi:hypothetical protein
MAFKENENDCPLRAVRARVTEDEVVEKDKSTLMKQISTMSVSWWTSEVCWSGDVHRPRSESVLLAYPF